MIEKLKILAGFIVMILVVLICCSILQGCAIGWINNDTDRAGIIGPGAYKSDEGSEISCLQIPQGVVRP